MNYDDFLLNKRYILNASGFDIEADKLNKNLLDYQKAIVKWSLKKGKCALFEDTGLGKTIQQLVWADEVVKHTNGKVLILAPLAVSKQTKNEGIKFNIELNLCERQEDVKNGINITNYEKIHKFDTNCFDGVVLDESSILKSYNGATTRDLIDRFKNTLYKLCCTATPSPNDFTEIGNHSEFLGIMTRSEMLSMFFINDVSHGDGWRLKGHSEKEFYKWIAEWGMLINNPSNLGFDGDMFNLPKLNIITHIIGSEKSENSLFVEYARTLQERREARKDSLEARVNKANEIVQNLDNCLVWCDFNNESELLSKTINGSVEVKGSDKPEHKETSMINFANGNLKILVSKPSICGFGMNWQNCNNMIFCGLSDSYEQFYQAIRRCWRFGQTKEVNVYVIISEKEMNVLENIRKKEDNHKRMTEEMINIMSDILKCEIKNTTRKNTEYIPKEEIMLPKFLLGVD